MDPAILIMLFNASASGSGTNGPKTFATSLLIAAAGFVTGVAGTYGIWRWSIWHNGLK